MSNQVLSSKRKNRIIILSPDFSDSKVLTVVFSFSGVATTSWVMSEIAYKFHTDNQHLTPGRYYLHFGASDRDTHSTSQPWFVWLGVCSLIPYAISLAVLKVLRLR